MQNVLIVEDDNLQAGMLSTTISQKYPDWTITHTDNLEQALKIIDDSVHTINFTLFLLDIHLTEMEMIKVDMLLRNIFVVLMFILKHRYYF